MARKHKIIWLTMLLLTPIFIYIIYFTDLIAPTYKYVRMKDGTEYHDVKLKWVSDHDVRVDGTYYTQFDIDSLSR
jgi:hypothetical protein